MIQSVDKSMRLLEILLKNRRAMSLKELSEALDAPKSTVHGLLAVMTAHEVLRQDSEGRYDLGLKLFECGCAVSEKWDISRAAHSCLEKLAEATGTGTFLTVFDGENVISVDHATGGEGLRIVPEIGVRLPLHATAQGKLFLAGLSDTRALQRLRRLGMPAFTPHTQTDPDLLLEQLREIRQRGYAVEDGEYRIGLRAAAAPVRDRGGQVRFALGFIGLFRRVVSPEFQSALAELTRQAAALSSEASPQGRHLDRPPSYPC